MGTTSSQPAPDEDPTTTVQTSDVAERRVPRYSPKMDDQAASQQLFNELELRAHYTPKRNMNVVATGTGRPTSRLRKTAGARNTKKRPAPTPATSQLAPLDDHPLLKSQSAQQSPSSQTYTEGNAAKEASGQSPVLSSEALVEEEQPARPDVEVPDSQGATTAVNALMSPPMTSSFSVPASVSKKQSQMRTRKSRARAEVNSDNILPEGKAPESDRKALFLAQDIPQRQRKRSSYLMPPRSSETDLTHFSDDKVLTEAQPRSIPGSEVVGTPDQSPRDVRVLEITQSGGQSADDDFIPGQSQRLKKKIWRLNKAKPDSSSRQTARIHKVDDADGEEAEKDHGSRPSPDVDVDAGTVKLTPRKQSRQNETRPKIRKSIHHPNDHMTAADRALATMRELHHPLDLRRDGDFTSDEDELIRRAIWDYKERRGLETSDIVDIIQWTHDDIDAVDNWHSAVEKQALNASDAEHMQESREFWDEMQLTNLTRRPERIRRHIRSLYHAYKSGGWTKEEDEQLKDLHKLHPQKWKIISTIMSDRSMHDIQNRYRDYVQHGDKRNISAWSKAEEDLLVRAVTTVVQRDEDYRAEAGLPPRAEYANRDINWPQVSSEMGGTRSRLQSSVKWSRLQAREFPPQIVVEIKPRREGGQVTGDNHLSLDGTPRQRARFSRKIGTEPTTNTPRKRGRPLKSGSVAGDKKGRAAKRHRLAQDTDTPCGSDAGTPLQKNPHQSVVDISDMGKMCIGDKFDLAVALSYRGDDCEQDIDWLDVKAVMKNTWSIQTLQAAFHELLEEHKKRADCLESFSAAVDAIVDDFVEQYPEKLAEHYDPTYDIGLDDKIAPANEEEEEPAAANTKKKRQRGGLKSRSASTKVFKSQEFVAESDDTGSEHGP